ncbi:MAG TPA: flagellar motor protein [archaeon]|nr:flagellar motor protein [archaeon]
MATGVDKASVSGVTLAVGGIVLGLVLEGGRIGQILQPTAALIVFGGTLGAILVQFPLRSVLAAFASLARVFFERAENPQEAVQRIVQYAHKARREGIVSLDAQLAEIEEPFLKKSLMLAIDGTEPAELRRIMELELDNRADRDEVIPRVFESAGGFSPTIGIIGAVLGLIQVMQHLDNITEVGKGIAVAFVATIYGVGSANLFFLPAAGKLRHRQREEQLRQEIILEGVISILEGMNPRMIDTKLQSFLSEAQQEATA